MDKNRILNQKVNLKHIGQTMDLINSIIFIYEEKIMSENMKFLNANIIKKLDIYLAMDNLK